VRQRAAAAKHAYPSARFSVERQRGQEIDNDVSGKAKSELSRRAR